MQPLLFPPQQKSSEYPNKKNHVCGEKTNKNDNHILFMINEDGQPPPKTTSKSHPKICE